MQVRFPKDEDTCSQILHPKRGLISRNAPRKHEAICSLIHKPKLPLVNNTHIRYHLEASISHACLLLAGSSRAHTQSCSCRTAQNARTSPHAACLPMPAICSLANQQLSPHRHLARLLLRFSSTVKHSMQGHPHKVEHTARATVRAFSTRNSWSRCSTERYSTPRKRALPLSAGKG